MSQWDDLIQSAGQKYNVDPRLIASVVHVESGGNPNAYNSEFGATGLTQIIPDTAKRLGVDPKTPEGAIEGAAKLLDENLRRYGNAEQAILAYHGGTDQSNWGPKTQDYLRKITKQYGAPEVATTAPAVPDEFVSRFGPRPSAQSAVASPVDDASSAFMARFGPKPEQQAVAQVTTAQPAPESAPPQKGILDTARGLVEDLGAQGISNANAVGRGIMDVLDAPSEWAAAGAEKSGLTGLMGKVGINMPTYDQQVQQNAQSRASYDAANPDAGIQGMASRVGGNLMGTLAPIAGVEAGLVKGGQALSGALGNPQALASAGSFLRGQGGLASRVTYNAAQGGAAGALLSGGQTEGSTGDSAMLGAALGAAVPVAGAAARYVGNAGKALVAPFSEPGRQSIAASTLRREAGEAPGSMAQFEIPPMPASTGDAAADAAAMAAYRASAEDVISRAAAGGKMAANFNELVPGSKPTLGQATGNSGLLALENAAKSRSSNAFSERDMANYQARNAYLDGIRGTPQTLEAAIATRESATAPLREASLSGARPANSNPVIDEIDKILKGPEGQRDAVVNALGSVRSKLDLGENGAQSDVAQLYGVRKAIGDQLDKVAGRDNSSSQLASRELLQVRNVLDDVMEKAAPGFAKYRETYADLSKPINAQNYLQNLNLTDSSSLRITLPKMKEAISKIEKLRKSPGSNEAKSISDDQMEALNNLHKDLQRESGTAAGRVRASDTFQNMATNQLIDAMVPGGSVLVGKVAPSAIGGALGMAMGGPVGAGIGAVGAQQAAGVAGRAMNAQAPEIEARLIDYLLNPRGAEVLAPRSAAQSSGLEELLRRSVPATSGVAAPSGGNKN